MDIIEIDTTSQHYKIATRFDGSTFGCATICQYSKRIAFVLFLETTLAFLIGSVLTVILIEITSLIQYGNFSDMMGSTSVDVGIFLVYMSGIGMMGTFTFFGILILITKIANVLTDEDTKSVAILSYRAWKQKWCPLIKFV